MHNTDCDQCSVARSGLPATHTQSRSLAGCVFVCLCVCARVCARIPFVSTPGKGRGLVCAFVYQSKYVCLCAHVYMCVKVCEYANAWSCVCALHLTTQQYSTHRSLAELDVYK